MSIDLALLGTMSDAALGRQVSLSRERIRQLREEHGIPAFAATPGRSREVRILQALNRLPAETTAKIADGAGKRPDAELAAELGIDAKIVAVYRQTNGLAVYKPAPAYTAEQLAILTNPAIPSGEAAERVGCSAMTVWRYRNGRASPRT